MPRIPADSHRSPLNASLWTMAGHPCGDTLECHEEEVVVNELFPCQNARVLEYRETEERIQVVGNCAVASFRFEMVYERPACAPNAARADSPLVS
jgi:hypothetical protein